MRSKHFKIIIILAILLSICLILIFFNLKPVNKQEVVERVIQKSLDLEPIQTEHNELSLVPTRYEYNTRDQSLTVYLDYKVESISDLPDFGLQLPDLYMELLFPGSEIPDIRNKTYLPTVNKDKDGKSASFTFQIPGYNYDTFGRAKLIFTGAHIATLLPDQQIHSFSMGKDTVPYIIDIKDIARFTYKEISVDRDHSTISTVLESHSYNKFRAEPFIETKVTENGRPINAFSTSTTTNHNIISESKRFESLPEQNLTLTFEIGAIHLFVDSPVDHHIFWRFSIEE